MTPPSSRRSGFSKKAQFSLFTGYLLAAAGALLGLVLLVFSLWQPAAFAPARNVASDVVSPAGSVSAAARTQSQSLMATMKGYINAGSQNADLRKQIEIAKIRAAEADAIKAENLRLKGLLDLQGTEAKPVIFARLVGSTATSARRLAYLNVGARHGVTPGMPIISERGVIGRVLETGNISTRVLLLTDSESVLPVRRAKDNVIAFAEGRGDGLLRVRLVNLGVNPLELGDLMVTSGAGGYYRPGVAVAVISEITNDGGIARLVAEPSATDFVAVEAIFQPTAVGALQGDAPLDDTASASPALPVSAATSDPG